MGGPLAGLEVLEELRAGAVFVWAYFKVAVLFLLKNLYDQAKKKLYS